MTWRTHVLCGIASLSLLTALRGVLEPSSMGPMAAAAAFGALLPDLDAVESKIRHIRIAGIQPFVLPSNGLNRAFGHRGVMHSFVGLAAFTLASSPVMLWLGWQAWAAFSLGYLSHLAADACTKSGIPFGLSRSRRFYLLPKVLRITTGSPEEDIVFTMAAVAAVVLLLEHLPFR